MPLLGIFVARVPESILGSCQWVIWMWGVLPGRGGAIFGLSKPSGVFDIPVIEAEGVVIVIFQGCSVDGSLNPGLESGTELGTAAGCLAISAEFGEDKLCNGMHPALANAKRADAWLLVKGN